MIALFCSYVVAMTVVPLFCSKFIKHTGHGNEHESAQSDDAVPEHMRGGHGQKNIFARVVYHFNQAGSKAATMEQSITVSVAPVLSSSASLSSWSSASH